MMRSASLRNRILLVAIIAILPTAGCRLCCETDDHTYSAYGGAWERTRRDSGRVGSIFDPAGAKASTLVERDEPDRPEVLDRERRKDDPDAYSLEPDKDPSRPEMPEDDTDDDEALRKRIEELRNQQLEDIDAEPGKLVPPTLF